MYFLFEIQDKYIIMFGVIVLALLAGGVVLFLALNKKNKVKPIAENERYEENDLEFNSNVEMTELKKKEELTEEQKKARAELEKVFNQMNADLQKDSEKVVDDFEREQEENAIISYQELIRQVKGIDLKEQTTSVEKFEMPVETEENTPVKTTVVDEKKEAPVKENYLEALENLKPNIDIDVKPVDIEERKPYSGSKTKFSTSEIISPIFGRQEPKNDIENTGIFKMDEAYTAISQNEEQKQNAEFLQTLKEFRNNL